MGKWKFLTYVYIVVVARFGLHSRPLFILLLRPRVLLYINKYDRALGMRLIAHILYYKYT